MSTVGGMRWRKVFRGEERQLGAMRRWLASLLPAVPARDVTGLSLRTGARGDQQGRLVWADVRWDGPGPIAGAVMPRTAPAA